MTLDRLAALEAEATKGPWRVANDVQLMVGPREAWRGQNVPVHREVYEALERLMPKGLVLDHLCRNKLCVNPRHLEPVTAAENTRRGGNGAKTACPRGHPYDIRRNGKRYCQTCERARGRRKP